jgi:hypothetical protein
MKLSELNHSTAFVTCPNCGARCVSPTSGNTVTCSQCHFKFSHDEQTAAAFSDEGLDPPYIAFSMRYGGAMSKGGSRGAAPLAPYVAGHHRISESKK